MRELVVLMISNRFGVLLENLAPAAVQRVSEGAFLRTEEKTTKSFSSTTRMTDHLKGVSKI